MILRLLRICLLSSILPSSVPVLADDVFRTELNAPIFFAQPAVPTLELEIAPEVPSYAMVGEQFRGDFALDGLSEMAFKGSRPPGIMIDSSGLSGFFTEAGDYAFSISGRRGSAPVASQTMSLTVDPMLSIDTDLDALYAARAGTAIAIPTIRASGGLPPYAYTSKHNAISVDAGGNVAVDTASPLSIKNTTIEVRDARGRPIPTGAFSIYVGPAMSVSQAEILGRIGVALQEPTVSGGVAPYAWSLDGGQLPAGTSIVAGRISGQPSAASTGSAVLAADDDLGNEATANVTWTVLPAVAFSNLQGSYQTNTGTTLTIAPTYSNLSTKGYATRTFSLIGAPANMSIGSTGVISFAPTAAVPQTNVRIKVRDIDGYEFTSDAFMVSATAPAPPASNYSPSWSWSTQNEVKRTATGTFPVQVRATTAVVSVTQSQSQCGTRSLAVNVYKANSSSGPWTLVGNNTTYTSRLCHSQNLSTTVTFSETTSRYYQIVMETNNYLGNSEITGSSITLK